MLDSSFDETDKGRVIETTEVLGGPSLLTIKILVKLLHKNFMLFRLVLGADFWDLGTWSCRFLLV